MDKRTTGIIATVATALLCGCPGLFGLCMGSISLLASVIPGAEIDVFGSSDPGAASTMGIVFLCMSVIFIAIPIVVGVVTLRKKPEDAAAPVAATPVAMSEPPKAPTPAPAPPSEKPVPPVDDEPLPPAS